MSCSHFCTLLIKFFWRLKSPASMTCLTCEGSVVFAFVLREDHWLLAICIDPGWRWEVWSDIFRPLPLNTHALRTLQKWLQGHEQKHNSRESICAKKFKELHKNYNIKTKKVDLYEEFWWISSLNPVWHSFLYLANLKLQLCNRSELCQTVLSLLYKVVFTFSSCNKSQLFLICTNLNIL